MYSGVIEDHRKATEMIGKIDPVTEDLFIGQLRQLELFQWFIRAHLKDASGDVVFRDGGSQASAEGRKNGSGKASNGTQVNRSQSNGAKAKKAAARR